MRKIILTISLVVMALSFTACAKEPSAQEIVDGVIHSTDEIRTYQYDINGTIDMTFEVEGEVSESTFAESYSYTVDVENRQARIDVTMTTITGQPDITEGVEVYVIDGMAYLKLETPGEEPTWVKEEVSEDWLEEWQESGEMGMVYYADSIEILEAAQVEVIGSENVSGIDCYVLEVTPALQKLWQIYSHLVYQEASDVTEEYIQEVIRSFSVEYWVAKDTYFLMKAEIEIATELPPETPGPTKFDISMVLLAYNYNQPVSIALPPEAEETIEIPVE
jgi:hypothetical protein